MSGRKADNAAERGSSLASALLLVAVMSLVALSLVGDLRVAMRRSGNMEFRDQAHWYAMGARDYTETLIERAMDTPETTFRPDAEWLAGPSIFPIENGQLVGRIHDGNNCFNLNGLVTMDERGRTQADPEQQRRFEILLTELGLQSNQAAMIAAQAVDWIDSDNRPVSAGAEDPSYARAERPYRTGNTLMAEREELLALEAMTPALYAQIADLVCARPVAEPLRLNINTLGVGQLPLLIAAFEGELTLASAEAVLQQRPAEGFANLDLFWALDEIAALQVDASRRNVVGLASTYFEIEIDVLYSGMRYQLRETVEHRTSGRPVRLSQRYGMFS